MRRLTYAAAPLALVAMIGLASGCDKKDADAPAPAAKAEAPAASKAPAKTEIAAAKAGNTATKVGLDTGGKALGGAAVKLNALQFGGKDYDASFNEALDSWTIEKWVPNDDEGNDLAVRIYLDEWDSDWPSDVEAFAKKLAGKGFLDMGETWTVASRNKAGANWIISGSSSDGEDSEESFAVRLGDLNILCRGSVTEDVPEDERDAMRTDGIEACLATTAKE